MKKSHYFAITLSSLFFILFSTVAIAQQRAQTGIVLKQGNYTTASENPNDLFGHCSCGIAQFDCLCGFVDYHDINEAVVVGQIVVGVSSHEVLGNTLKIIFKEKLKMKLKTNDFTQKEKVIINSEVAKSLGYKSITILPGNYTIRGENSITFNIERGEALIPMIKATVAVTSDCKKGWTCGSWAYSLTKVNAITITNLTTTWYPSLQYSIYPNATGIGSPIATFTCNQSPVTFASPLLPNGQTYYVKLKDVNSSNSTGYAFTIGSFNGQKCTVTPVGGITEKL